MVSIAEALRAKGNQVFSNIKIEPDNLEKILSKIRHVNTDDKIEYRPKTQMAYIFGSHEIFTRAGSAYRNIEEIYKWTTSESYEMYKKSLNVRKSIMGGEIIILHTDVIEESKNKNNNPTEEEPVKIIVMVRTKIEDRDAAAAWLKNFFP